MARGFSGFLFSLLLLYTISLMLTCVATGPEISTVAGTGGESNSILFVFGDSSVDPGNNNYIETTPENRANYKPYGQNGFFQAPTGRFSDGRIIVDYLCEYANLPLIPPFLQPSAEFIHGANFASGGAGVLPETNQGMVIDLKKQLEHFEEVRKSIVETMGDAKGMKSISEAVYLISIGSNDYMGGYLGSPETQQLYQPQEFVRMVVGNLTQAIQELYNKGGRKFGFVSLSPLGCLPALRAVNPKATEEGGCFEEASALALAHNEALKSVLNSLAQLLQDFKYCHSNFYTWLLDRMENPSKHGFKEGVKACCGKGPFRGVFTCGGTKNITEYEVCDNADDYVWWDSFHPTERIHEKFAKVLWGDDDDDGSYVGPYTIQQLFFSNQDNRHLKIADIVDDPHHANTQLI